MRKSKLSFKERLKKIYFSRRFLSKKLQKEGHLFCHYCSKDNLKIEWDFLNPVADYEKATLDHKVPISKGGDLKDKKNLLVACGSCNTKKGSKDYEEFFKESLNLQY